MATPDEATPTTDWRDEPIRSTRSIQTPYGEQDENGTDLSLIRWLLAMSPAERLMWGDRARDDALRLQEIGRRQRQGQRPAFDR